MAVLNFNTEMPAATSNRRQPFAGLRQDDRPAANLWLNVGYMAGDKFINLPLGLPIDTMEPVSIRGQNEDYIKQMTARNQLLQALQEAGARLAPGESVNVNLTIQLRRVNNELKIAGENEYAVNLSGLFSAPAEAVTE